MVSDDGHGGTYSKTFTLQVQDDPNYPPVNPQPPQPQPNHEGTVTVSGTAKVGETLSATVADEDGVPQDGIKYQWQRDGADIKDATGATYNSAPTTPDTKSAQAEYQDNGKHAESPVSSATEVPRRQQPAGWKPCADRYRDRQRPGTGRTNPARGQHPCR